MPRKGKGNVSTEGQELLEDKEIWGNEPSLHGAVYESRKRERSNEDGLFMSHQEDQSHPHSLSTGTSGRDRDERLGEWMKMTSIRSQDQRRMLRTNSHTFPTNVWIHKITKGKESDRCDLCRFPNKPWDTSNTLTNPYQQHTSMLTTNVGYDHRLQNGSFHVSQTRNTSRRESFWWMWPDGIAVLPPVGNTAGIFCILEHKRMSDVCDRYLIRSKSTVENQYASLRGTISTVIHRQGWRVEQISFITGARSVDKQDLSKNLKFFRVPEVSINSMYSKLVMRTFDVTLNREYCQMHV
jgi:hypothetical protein